MVFSFLFCKANRKLSLSHSSLPSTLPCPFLHMHYTLLSLLFHMPPLCFSNPMLSYILHTTYCAAVPCSETLAPGFPEFSSSYNHILCTPQISLLLLISFTSPYTLLLPLKAALLPHYAPSPSFIPLMVVPFPLFSFVGTPTSCALFSYTWNNIAFLLLLPTFSLLLLHTALLYLPVLQIYSSSFSSSFPLLFLQFLAKWPNCLHSQHFFPSLSSIFDLILVSARLVLSILLNRSLYISKNIVFVT